MDEFNDEDKEEEALAKRVCPSCHCGMDTVHERRHVMMPNPISGNVDKLLIRFPVLKCPICGDTHFFDGTQTVFQQAIEDHIKSTSTALNENIYTGLRKEVDKRIGDMDDQYKIKNRWHGHRMYLNGIMDGVIGVIAVIAFIHHNWSLGIWYSMFGIIYASMHFTNWPFHVVTFLLHKVTTMKQKMIASHEHRMSKNAGEKKA